MSSPYFAPEFTATVAAARTDVEIAVIRDGTAVVAILPYQRATRALAVPVGGILSDYHGFVCAPDFSCEPEDVLRQCGLSAWDFNHLIATQAFLAPYHERRDPSPQMDLSRGYEAYASARQRAGTDQLRKSENLVRRIEREVGSLRFVADAADPATLATVLGWKSKQYASTGKPDLFRVHWIRDLVERVHATRSPGFSGMLSVLYAGDRIIAGHFGMRSESVWHYWFPAYDVTFATYSPGVMLLLQMAKASASLGVRTIDLGQGVEAYKERLMSGAVMVAGGSVERSSLLRARRRVLRRAKSIVTATPLGEPARRFIRMLRRRSLA